MRKLLMTVVAVLLAPMASAGSALILARNFDPDSLSYYYPIYCSGVANTQSVVICPGNGNFVGDRPATTSGASSTTVTSVGSKDSFAGLAAGDLIIFNVPDVTTGAGTGQTLRQVTAVASNNSITMDSNVTLPTAGASFSWLRSEIGSASTEGWFDVQGASALTIQLQIDQISVTGGLDYSVECGVTLATGGTATPLTYDSVATANLTATGTTTVALSEPYTMCRVGMKAGTADDDVVTITAGTDDDIDFKEYVNSYTITLNTDDDIDFTEDPTGVPNACLATLTAGTYTGATLCTEIATQMNGAACTPANTYSCSYSTTTHKFTIARSAGALAFDMPWTTGANTATSAKTILGYTADDTGAVSYVSDDATGESAEITATLTAGLYATGDALCDEVETQLTAGAIAGTYTCTYAAATDKVTIAASGITQLMILWNSGTNAATSADVQLGYAADSTGALSYLAPTALGLDGANDIEKVTIMVGRR